VICRRIARRERARFLLARSGAAISSRGRHGKFRVRPTMPQKEAARSSFLARLKSSQRGARSVAYPAAREGQRAFYFSRFVPARTRAALGRMFLRFQRELDVVLLHEGISRPALAIRRSPSPRSESHYEREAANAARCG